VSSPARSRPVRALAVMILTAASTLMIGAANETGEALARLRRMPPDQRSQLEANLKRFDQVLTPEQQKSLRAIDERIGRLPAEEKVHYLAVLRRYHNWLNSLPETVKTNLLAKPPSERVSQIQSLSARYPVPTAGSPRWLRFADGGTASILELAAIFKIWQEVTPDQRREVENPPAGKRRLEILLRNPHGNRMLREVRPADFVEDEWVPKAEASLKEILVVEPELKEAFAKAKSELSSLKGQNEAAIEKVRMNRLRRAAINLYLQEHPPRPVDPANLTRFLAAMPPWIQTTFDSLPADEARRRLTLVYRLVYPSGEFKESATSKPKPAPAVDRGTGPASTPAPPTPTPARPRDRAVPKPPRPSNAPF
jgi:hypothetical protein